MSLQISPVDLKKLLKINAQQILVKIDGNIPNTWENFFWRKT
jgi:hypothetical protein